MISDNLVNHVTVKDIQEQPADISLAVWKFMVSLISIDINMSEFKENHEDNDSNEKYLKDDVENEKKQL